MNNNIINYFKKKIKSKEESDKEISTETYKYKEIIDHAKEIKLKKEKYKEEEQNYLIAVKAGDKDLADKLKNNLFEIENQIALSESFLRNNINNIKKSEINIEEKTKIINYICGIAKIKTKEKDNKSINKNPIKSEIENLNIKKEKILSSNNITNSQKKNMLEKIDEEIIKLEKEE